MRTTLLSAGILGLALVAGGCSRELASPSKVDFATHLTGGEQVPAVSTTATGTASFWLSPDGTMIRYKLTIADLQNVNMIHLHLGAVGKNGPPVVWLYPSRPPSKEIAGPFPGVLSEGSITANDLVGPMEGKTIADLVTAIKSHAIYVNVHTRDHSDGEIRGQLR